MSPKRKKKGKDHRNLKDDPRKSKRSPGGAGYNAWLENPNESKTEFKESGNNKKTSILLNSQRNEENIDIGNDSIESRSIDRTEVDGGDSFADARLNPNSLIPS